jgi:hypothetical protein
MTAPQPMRVLNDTVVSWGQHANGVPMRRFVRHGAAVSIAPGSALYAAYGGNSGNLAVISADGDQANTVDLSEVDN